MAEFNLDAYLTAKSACCDITMAESSLDARLAARRQMPARQPSRRALAERPQYRLALARQGRGQPLTQLGGLPAAEKEL
jgi:hypothetical protein